MASLGLIVWELFAIFNFSAWPTTEMYDRKSLAYINRSVKNTTEIFTTADLTDPSRQVHAPKAIFGQTGSVNMAETGKMNLQPSTSYSTIIQGMNLSATVSTLETTSGFFGTPTGSVPRNGTLSIARGTTRARRRRNVEKRRKIAFGSPCSRNRMQKYGGKHANEFADAEFLFDFVYISGSISTPSGRL